MGVNKMGKIKNNANVEFIGQGTTGEPFSRAWCSNTGENDRCSWGDVEYYPQYSWHLDHQEDKRKFKSGDKVRIRAVDNENGPRGRFFCSNSGPGLPSPSRMARTTSRTATPTAGRSSA